MTGPAASRPRRTFVAGLAHETNSFSPLPTSLRNFEEDICYRPPETRGRELALGFAGYGDALVVARAAGDDVVEGPCFWTQPSGPVAAPLYALLRDAILDRLRDAGAVDIVILNLHGAMLAEGTDDPEADILAHVRALVGPGVAIGAILDLHGNISPEMIETGALLVGCKEYPHTDYRARVEELHALLTDVATTGARFETTLRTIPLLGLQGTTEEPMRGLVRLLGDAEGRDGIRSVTLMHGFPWSDGPHTGASILIISQQADRSNVRRFADGIETRYRAILDAAPVRRLGVQDAVAEALANPSGPGPVIIADSSDNPGGGAAGDSNFLLRALLDRSVDGAALGMIWDPQAARLCADAGVGARLALRVGGKTGPLSGDPLDVDAEVLAVRDDVQQRFFSETPNTPLGLAVALRIGGIEIVVNTIRQQVFAPECFTEMGIDLAQKAVVVVKSSQHFRARFDPIARRTIYCNAPGSLNTDLSQMPYRRLRLVQGQNAFTIDRPARWVDWPRTDQETP